MKFSALLMLASALLLLAVLPTNLGFIGEYFEFPGHVLAVFITAVVLNVILNYIYILWLNKNVRIFLASATALLIWLLIEILQEQLPAHGVERIDIIADFVGFVVSLVLLWRLERINDSYERVDG